MDVFPYEAHRRKESEVSYHEGDKVSILEMSITDRKHQSMEHIIMITPALHDALKILSVSLVDSYRVNVQLEDNPSCRHFQTPWKTISLSQQKLSAFFACNRSMEAVVIWHASTQCHHAWK